MKNTKEDVADTIKYIANGLYEIANDILNEEYDPNKWIKLSQEMSNVQACLIIEPYKFMANNKKLTK